MTTAIIEPQPVPLRRDDSGAIRIGDSRVLLELVIEAYLDGVTPEAIVRRFENLRLADVYAVINYYLNHSEEVGIPAAARRRGGGGKAQDRSSPTAAPSFPGRVAGPPCPSGER